jgi:hypothetical protein
MNIETATRFLGHCQICEQEQKLHDGKLVHHGYKRPGWGSIVGDCYGVHAVSYEVSCELTKKYLATIILPHVANVKENLAELKSGKVTHFTEASSWRGSTDYAVGVSELYVWTRALESRIHAVEWDLRQLASEVARLEKLIANWKLTTIKTIKERVEEERQAKAARAADRLAARQAKQAKIDATKAKQQALADKRKAIREDFEGKFRALATGTESLADRQKAARTLLNELDKTKYRNWLGKWDLECEDAFIALGLAKQEGVNGRGRPYLKWA